MRTRLSRTVTAVVGLHICFLFVVQVGAAVRVADIFGDNMVLQRAKSVPVWGWADPGEKVTVELAGQKQQAKTNSEGRWQVELSPLTAGGPHVMTIGGSNTVTFRNVLVGEVWIASGQSNMSWRVGGSMNSAEEIASADYPEIRHFGVANEVADQPQDRLKGAWRVCSPTTVSRFTAVGYFFARRLHRELGVPIGIIHSSWGGTPAESWTTRATLESHKELLPIVERYEKAAARYPQAMKEYNEKLAKWKEKPQYQEDPGNRGFDKGWAKPDFDDGKWAEMALPRTWEGVMKIDGAVWFRKAVEIPPALAGKEIELSLGRIDDFDVTYFNGVQIGRTGKETPKSWASQRLYAVPAKLVKAGGAILAVRVFDRKGNGGFGGPSMKLAVKGSREAISLAGPWKYAVELELDPSSLAGRRPGKPRGPGHPYSPVGLYNAMIHPLVPYAIRGAIWYQGESNVGRAYQYRTLFPAMIKDWRTAWKEDFPFLFVQLANYMGRAKKPTESFWAELREAQLMTLSLPNTGMATIIDIGEAGSIHPRNKQDVGKRLALWAMAKTYDKDVVYSGPLYKSMEIKGDKIRLRFDCVAGGLVAKAGDRLTGFAIAGEDRKFVWADATIDGDEVVVSSPQVATPAAVRYAWANNPACNLYNTADLPASPFRTDTWKGVTSGKY